MTAGDDLVDFLLRLQVLGLVERPVVNERDRVLYVLALERKQVAHGFQRNKDAGVGAIVAVLSNFCQHTDDVKTNFVQQQRSPDRWAAGKDVLEQFPSHHGNPAMLRVVFIVEPATRSDGDISDLVIDRRHAKHLAVGGSVVADRANVLAIDHWRKHAQRVGFIANREVIVVGEMIGLARLQAARHGGNPSGENKHNVLAKIGQLFRLPATEAFPQPHKKQ